MATAAAAMRFAALVAFLTQNRTGRGGRIRHVREHIRVIVRGLSGSAAVGRFPGFRLFLGHLAEKS